MCRTNSHVASRGIKGKNIRAAAPIMSSGQEESNDNEPQSKKRKIDVSDGEVYSDDLGGPMYTEATARRILKGVVPFDGGLMVIGGGEQVVGFKADDSTLNDLYSLNDFGDRFVTPMIYFARQGDLKMCRYLVSRGASTTKTSDEATGRFWCPMYAAASAGYLEICKFLYGNGAQGDIRRINRLGWSPFLAAMIDNRHKLIRWLVLHGALCVDGNSDVIDVERLLKQGRFMNNPSSYHSCRKLLEWAKERTQNHSSLLMFLRGTLPPSDSKTGHSCILQNLSGYLGVRKKIAAFVRTEYLTAKQLRILHQLTEVLPSVMSDLNPNNMYM